MAFGGIGLVAVLDKIALSLLLSESSRPSTVHRGSDASDSPD
jgi:hypothetical protein